MAAGFVEARILCILSFPLSGIVCTSSMMSQIEDMARLCQKCFIGFNKSCDAHPEMLREEFGDPDFANVVVPVTARRVASARSFI